MSAKDEIRRLQEEISNPEHANNYRCRRCGAPFSARCWPGDENTLPTENPELRAFLTGLVELARRVNCDVFGFWMAYPDSLDLDKVGWRLQTEVWHVPVPDGSLEPFAARVFIGPFEAALEVPIAMHNCVELDEATQP